VIPVKVNVKLYGTLREYGPKGLEIGQAFPVELTKGFVSEIIRALRFKVEQTKIIMVNGIRVVDLNHALEDGDLVVIFPPTGGG